MVYKVKIVNGEGVLKGSPEQSSAIRARGIPNTLIEGIPQGTELLCDDVAFYEGKVVSDEIDGDDHYILQLQSPYPGTVGLRWFSWAKRTEVDEGEHPDPTDKPIIISDERKKDAAKAIQTMSKAAIEDGSSKAAEKDLGPLISIAGFKEKKRLYAPARFYGSTPSSFTWAEITKGGKRLPINSNITIAAIGTNNKQGIIHKMDKIRKMAGVPIIINSWYRPPSVNRAVGGSSRSEHLTGGGVDAYPSGLNLVDFTLQIAKDPDLNGGGLAVGRGFFHIDRGHKRRWAYPGGPSVNLW